MSDDSRSARAVPIAPALSSEQLYRRIEVLEKALYQTRVRPWANLRSNFEFRLARLVLDFGSLLPPHRVGKWSRIAGRRSPGRDLTVWRPEGQDDQPFTTLPRPLLQVEGARRLVPGRPNILVVSHSATRTGAPILALNLAERLADWCNVTCILVEGGELQSDFCACSVAVHVATPGRGRPVLYEAELDAITAHGSFDAAVLNSCHSAPVLPALERAGVPATTLVHEFTHTQAMANELLEVARLSQHLVFSSNMVCADTARQLGPEMPVNATVIPQGKCRVPRGHATTHSSAAERGRIAGLLRPKEAPQGEFVVIGAGTLEHRKGVDLFLDVADLALSRGVPMRFVWFGKGHENQMDQESIAYLAQATRKHGFGGRVQIVEPTSEIEHAYSLADVLLLTSRLDPLPNVAIDAMCAGRPVICFDGTTGLVEYLAEAGLSDEWVVPHLDVAAMADRIVAMAESPANTATAAARGAAFARKRFDFAAYADRIAALTLGSGQRKTRTDQVA